MLDNYDFSKAGKNPFAQVLNKNKTITLEDDIVAYFEDMSEKEKIPYQTLINLYLADCIRTHRKFAMTWKSE
jgi:hypothetical protein